MKKTIIMALAILLSVTALFAQEKKGSSAQVIKTSAKYTCPMHHQVVRSRPGKCPKCGMNLVRVKKKTNIKTMGDMKM